MSIKRKLQYKILWGALFLVFAVGVAITVVVSVIINKQNRKLVHDSMTTSLTVIKDSVMEKKIALAGMISQMATVTKMGDDVKFLKGFQDSGLDMTRQSYEKIGNSITNALLREDLWTIRVYSGDGSLISFAHRETTGEVIMGFQHASQFYFRKFQKGESYDRNQLFQSDQSPYDTLLPVYGTGLPQTLSTAFGTSGGFISLEASAPVTAYIWNKKTEKTEPAQVGVVFAQKRLSGSFVNRMSKITGKKINLFAGQNFSVGDVEQYQTIELSGIPKSMDQSQETRKYPFFYQDIAVAGVNYFQALLPVYSNAELIGSVVLLESDSVVKANTRQMIFMIGVVALVCMVFAATLAYVASGTIVKPLVIIVEKLKDIAQGEGDLTSRLNVSSEDEIGQVAFWFNAFIDKIHALVSDLSTNAGQLNQSAADLAQISKVMDTDACQTSQRARSVETSGEKMSDSMSSVAVSMDQASSNMGMVASATEQMSSTINEISKNTVSAKQITDDVVLKTTDASGQIEDLGRAADAIDEVIETIADISDQVNLLALNATIEAARAGEAGKGFAVVANEIKELANQTADATKEISEKVDKIRSSTSGTIDQVNTISRVVNEINDIVVMISSAVEEQTVTTQGISRNIVQVTQGVDEINSNISQSADAVGQIADEMRSVTVTAEQMTQNSAQVENRSKNLASLSGQLMNLVNKFKI